MIEVSDDEEGHVSEVESEEEELEIPQFDVPNVVM